MAFCTNCGAELPDGAKFCTECGTRIAPRSGKSAGTHSGFASHPGHGSPSGCGSRCGTGNAAHTQTGTSA